MINIIFEIDRYILLFIQNNLRNDYMTPAMGVITTIGNAGIIWIFITLILLCRKKTRKIGFMGITALLLSLIVNNLLLKNIVARPRPFQEIETLIPLIEKPKDWSFPSGHTAASFAAGFLYFRKLPRQAGIPMLILAILIAWSRLYLGVHYPSDVLVGVIDGIILSYFAGYIVERAAKKKA